VTVCVGMDDNWEEIFFSQLEDSDEVAFEEREGNKGDQDIEKEPTTKTYKNAISSHMNTYKSF